MLLVLSTKGRDTILHVFSDLRADFEPENEGVREERRERDEKTTEAAADICDSYWFSEGFGFARRGGIDVGWVVGGPVHLGGTGGARRREGWLVCWSVSLRGEEMRLGRGCTH